MSEVIFLAGFGLFLISSVMFAFVVVLDCFKCSVPIPLSRIGITICLISLILIASYILYKVLSISL